MSKSDEKLTPFEMQLVEMVEQAIALSVVEPQTKTADFVKEWQDKLFQAFFNNVLSKMDDAAETFARFYDQGTCDGIAQECFKSGVTWAVTQLNKEHEEPRPKWKPSEEQMKAMEEVRTIFHHHHLWDEINPILYDYEELMRDLYKLM